MWYVDWDTVKAGSAFWSSGFGLGFTGHGTITANSRKLEHGFRMISARFPYTLLEGHEDQNVPTFWLLLYI